MTGDDAVDPPYYPPRDADAWTHPGGGAPGYGPPPVPGGPAPHPPQGYDYPQVPGGPPPPPVYGYPQVPGYPPLRVAPKSPGLALLASFFIPGLGSMMNGNVGRGIGILVGYLVSILLVIVLVGLLGMLGFWIWGMVDAYQGAQRWNLRHGILS